MRYENWINGLDGGMKINVLINTTTNLGMNISTKNEMCKSKYTSGQFIKCHELNSWVCLCWNVAVNVIKFPIDLIIRILHRIFLLLSCTAIFCKIAFYEYYNN